MNILSREIAIRARHLLLYIYDYDRIIGEIYILSGESENRLRIRLSSIIKHELNIWTSK